MTAPLLLAYTVSGGSPPPTLESLRIFADGFARAIVTNAWPDGEPQDEAGLYETQLDEPAVARVRSLADSLPASAGEYGPIRADSGRSAIALGADGATIAWGAFATPPPEAARAAGELRAILAEVRCHPVAALRLSLAADQVQLTHRGSKPVAVSSVRPRIASFAGDGTPPLGLYREAAELPPLPDGELAGGETRGAPIDVPGGPLVAFATLTLELPTEPEPVALNGFLIARADR